MIEVGLVQQTGRAIGFLEGPYHFGVLDVVGLLR